jgi:hypothetical protein
MSDDRAFTIKDMLGTAETLRDELKKNGSTLNPHHHLELLLTSHKYTDYSLDASEFFYHIINDQEEFFAQKNMPENWSSIRSYSSAMESLKTLLDYEDIKKGVMKDMSSEDFATVYGIIDTKKKQYMNDAKKDSRKKKKGVNNVVNAPDDNVDAEMHENIDNEEEALNDEDPVHLPDFGKTIQKNKVEPSIRKEVGQATSHVQKALWILEKYMESETDDFKLILLEMIKEHLQSEVTHL